MEEGMKFKIGQPLILDESLKDRADWYKPGIFYLKKRYPSGTVKANKQDYLKNKNLINDDGTWKNELVECYNFEGESLICTESKFKPAQITIALIREIKLNEILFDADRINERVKFKLDKLQSKYLS